MSMNEVTKAQFFYGVLFINTSNILTADGVSEGRVIGIGIIGFFFGIMFAIKSA